MTIQSWLTEAAQRLAVDRPTIEAELLLCHRLKKSRAFLFAFPETPLSSQDQTALTQDLDKLVKGYPLAYLLGEQSFWDMTLTVTPDVLIPRSDSELMIELLIDYLPSTSKQHFVDLGTGSGALALALSREFPQATLTATDLSSKALAVAKTNAKVWQVAPVHFIQTTWLAGLSPCSFDVIVSNPPYIADNDPHLLDLLHEPLMALTSPDKGLADLKAIIEQAPTYLKPNGHLFLEHGYQQGQAVRALLSNQHWQQVHTHRDLGGNERITQATLSH